jgi:t-SNARE complex subunit (syntaxin)
MVNEPPTHMRDPGRHKWRLLDEMQRSLEEARAASADRVIRTIGGIILVAIVVVVVVGGLIFLIKHLW